MNSKWTGKDFGITAGISLVYFMITMVVMMSGALTPILWIFMPALIGFFTGIPYLYIVAKEAKPGVVFLMNLIVGVIYFIAGELSNLVIVTLIITTVLAEGVRKVGGYHNLKTTLFSHVIFSFGMFGNPLYIWVFPEYTVARATEEMSAEYATVMQNVAQIWMLPVMIAATVVLALVGSMLGKTVLKKTTFQRCADLNKGNPVPKGRRPTMLTSMDKRTVKLRASGEDYLEAILVLHKKMGMVRSVDVARHLEVTKPSVCHAVATLRDGGILTMDSGYFLHLTDVGREVAEQIYEKHRFFTDRLIEAGVDPVTAEKDACRMEHVISQESFERLRDAYKTKKE